MAFVIENGLLQSAMLLNRGIGFYSFVIISLCVVIFNIIKNKKIDKIQIKEK